MSISPTCYGQPLVQNFYAQLFCICLFLLVFYGKMKLVRWTDVSKNRLKDSLILKVHLLSFPDGLTDCGDSKCCSHDSCKKSIMCLYLADPVEVLLRKPPPTVTASFLKRVQFLFEGEESVQNYAKQDVFDDK